MRPFPSRCTFGQHRTTGYFHLNTNFLFPLIFYFFLFIICGSRGTEVIVSKEEILTWLEKLRFPFKITERFLLLIYYCSLWLVLRRIITLYMIPSPISSPSFVMHFHPIFSYAYDLFFDITKIIYYLEFTFFFLRIRDNFFILRYDITFLFYLYDFTFIFYDTW